MAWTGFRHSRRGKGARNKITMFPAHDSFLEFFSGREALHTIPMSISQAASAHCAKYISGCRAAKVDSYSKMMREGDWRDGSEISLLFHEDLIHILDGKHRMSAHARVPIDIVYTARIESLDSYTARKHSHFIR